jgi:hypothetical protein
MLYHNLSNMPEHRGRIDLLRQPAFPAPTCHGVAAWLRRIRNARITAMCPQCSAIAEMATELSNLMYLADRTHVGRMPECMSPLCRAE